MTADELLRTALQRYKREDDARDIFLGYLTLLKAHDEATWTHSIRVGILSGTIAETCAEARLDPSTLFWAGLVHDIGKLLIDPALLQKTKEFSDDDFRIMERHVEYGRLLLCHADDVIAQIVVRHHRFGARPYPKKLPLLSPQLQKSKRLFNRHARIIALADFYDALVYRKNEKFNDVASPQKKREVFRSAHLKDHTLIDVLEEQGVLTYDPATEDSA